MFTEKFSKRLVWLGIISFFLGLAFFVYYQPLFKLNAPIETDKFGQFGDLIGGIIGSMWALAGVILFYVALKEQRKDFKTNQEALKTQMNAFEQQIKEFELQRHELEETRKVFKVQSKSLQLQQFESTFFNMIDGQLSIVDSIGYFESLTAKIKAKYEFYEICFKDEDYVGLKNNIPKELGINREKQIEIRKEYASGNNMNISRLSYATIFLVYHKHLGHYFRHLYHILKFIEKHDLENEKVSQSNLEDRIDFAGYADILQSRLSSYELSLLFYNMLFFPNVVRLVKKYHFLENLSAEDLIETKHKAYFDIKIASRLERLKI